MSGFWRRHGANVVVLGAAAGLGVWVFAVEPKLGTTEERERRAKHLFHDFSRSGLTAIEIEPASGPRVAVTRASGDVAWSMLVDGKAVEADEAAVDKLAAAIEYATVLREATSGAFGLEVPRLRGAIVVRGKRYAFSLGAEAPGAAGIAYVRVEGEPVRVVAAAFVAEVLAPASRLFDRRVVPYLSIETRAVEILAGGAPRAAFERLDDRLWRLQGEPTRVARSESDAFWASIGNLTSERELAPGSFDAAGGEVLTVRLVPRDGRAPASLELRAGCLGGPGATMRLTGPRSREVCVGAAPYGALAAFTREGLRDRSPIAARPDEIQAIRIEEGGAAFELARKGTGFEVRSDHDRPVPAELTEDVVGWLGDLGRPATPIARASAAEPLGFVRVFTEQREPYEVLAMVARTGDRVTLRRESDGALLELAGSAAQRMSTRGAWLRSRVVFEGGLESRAVRRLELRCAGASQVVERGTNGWAFVEPSGAPADGAHALDVATKILATRVDRWLEGPETLGPAACSAAVTFEGDGGDARVELKLGAAREGALVATASGVSDAFLVPKSTRDLLTGSLVDRVLGPGTLDDAATITLSRGRHDAIFVRTPQGFRLRGAEQNAALADRFTGRLAGLVADGVVHVGAGTGADGLAPPVAAITWSSREGKVLGTLAFGRPVTKEGERVVPVASPRGGAVLALRADAFEALFEAVP